MKDGYVWPDTPPTNMGYLSIDVALGVGKNFSINFVITKIVHVEDLT
jgi:hypothetical protein